MADSDKTAYQLTLYSADVCWKGELAFPANRRVSDYINDTHVPVLILKDAVRLTWENNSLRMLEGIDSIAVYKRNVLVICPNANPPNPPELHPSLRINKVPVHIMMHIPPLVLSGDINIVPSAELISAIDNARTNFIVATNVNLWHYKTHMPLGTNLKFALINLQHVNGIEIDEQTSKDTKPSSG